MPKNTTKMFEKILAASKTMERMKKALIKYPGLTFIFEHSLFRGSTSLKGSSTLETMASS